MACFGPRAAGQRESAAIVAAIAAGRRMIRERMRGIKACL